MIEVSMANQLIKDNNRYLTSFWSKARDLLREFA